MPGPVRVLSNVALPALEGWSVRTFEQCRDGAPSPYRDEKERRPLARILASIPPEEAPEVLVIGHPEYLAAPVDVASFPGLRILLITDWNVNLRWLPDFCLLFDHCFTDWPGYLLLTEAGVRNVRPQALFGHDPARFRDLGRPRDLDVSFCGNLNSGMHGERNRLLCRLALWGAGRPVHLDQAFDQAYVDILNRSRLVFNYAIRGEANMRLFEAMACGAVPLVEASNREVPRLFREGEHYFAYEPHRLEATLESLLADPARIERVARAARDAVAAHTRGAQMAAMLETARRLGPASPEDRRAAASRGAASLKALVRMRILGAGYGVQESLAEAQALAPALPGLEAETLPALLLTALESEPGLPAARSSLEARLDPAASPASLPAALRHALRMRLRRLDGDWAGVRSEAERCLQSLAEPALPGPDPYDCLHVPAPAAQALNADLNRAWREDRGTGSRRAYADLMAAHCHEHLARAALAQGRPAEALEHARRVPRDRWASCGAHALRVDAALALRDRDLVRAYIEEWFADLPLDSAVWHRGLAALLETGDREGLGRFLGDVAVLASHFLRVELKFSRK